MARAMRPEVRVLLVLGLFALPGCGGGGGGGGSTSKGQVALFLKDGPITTSDGRPADQVNVEILRIQLERASEEADADHDVTVFQKGAGSGIQLNLLALDIPMLLTTVKAPTGQYDKIELRLNPSNATIHFTDGSPQPLVPLVITEEGEDEAELEFEFSAPFTVSEEGVINALVDFVPVVTLSGGNYVLGHDHENDETGEIEDIDDMEVEGTFVRREGEDQLLLKVNGNNTLVQFSDATTFMIDDSSVDKATFLAALAQGVRVEAEGGFQGNVIAAQKIKIENEES